MNHLPPASSPEQTGWLFFQYNTIVVESPSDEFKSLNTIKYVTIVNEFALCDF